MWTNDEIIERLFPKRSIEENPFTKKIYDEVGEVVGEKIDFVKVNYLVRILKPDHTKSVDDQFAIVMETALLERRIHDIDDVLLNKQIDSIRKVKNFIDFAMTE